MKKENLLTSALHILGPKLFSRTPQSEVCEALGLLDQKQMANRLGLSYEAFRWRLSTGRIPRPEVRLGKRAYYTEQQAHRLVDGALEMGEAQSNNSGDQIKEDNDGPEEA